MGRPVSLLTLALLVAACGGGSTNNPGGPTDPGGATGGLPGVSAGSLVFRASPVALEAIRFITPLGNLNPPDHTLPTDHIYFYFADPSLGESPAARRTAFFAPADGTVADVIDNGVGGGDRKIRVQATATVVYYVDHLIPEIALSRGTRLTAGQRLGTTASAFGIDLGVVNDALTLAFVNPSRYGSETLHADAPLKYYEEPLRSQLYARVQRVGPDLDGKIDVDVPGRLSGAWFGDGDAAPLAFVYDTYDPSQVRISVARGLSQTGVFAIAVTDPLPRDVTVASGTVTYTISRSRTGPPVGGTPTGRLLVQMLDDRRIRAEIFPQLTGALDFTSAAKGFTR